MPSDASQENRLAFARLVAQPETRLDLVAGCLHIAAEAQPGLAFKPTYERLDRLAERTESFGTEGATSDRLTALHRVLYEEHGLRGDHVSYYDPRNSYLQEVLERRVGLPITLSVVEIEVGRRSGLRLHGIGFPGHFLVGAPGGAVIDAFDRGRLLSREDLEALLGRVHHPHDAGRLPVPASLLRPTTKREILTRILSNLRGVFLRRQDPHALLWTLELLAILQPAEWALTRERALLLGRMGHSTAAAAALERYLEEHAGALDDPAVRKALATLRSRLN